MAYTKTLRTYRFRDKDPVIDEMRTAIQDEGLFGRLSDVADLASLAHATLDNWFHGDTRCPQNRNVMAVMTSLGYQRKWLRERKLNLDEELVFARAWNKKERQKAEAARKAAAPTKKRNRRKRKVAYVA